MGEFHEDMHDAVACPFCGNSDRICWTVHEDWIYCDTCGAAGPTITIAWDERPRDQRRDEALRLWNARSTSRAAGGEG